MALTPKQTLFVAEYLVNGLNATKAYKSAGYAERNAEVCASQLLRNPKVAEAISAKTGKRLNKLEITADYVLGAIQESLEACRLGSDHALVFKGAELLGKHLKLFTDKSEVTGKDGGPLEVSVKRVVTDL
jgi:phage terminase small subunit